MATTFAQSERKQTKNFGALCSAKLCRLIAKKKKG